MTYITQCIPDAGLAIHHDGQTEVSRERFVESLRKQCPQWAKSIQMAMTDLKLSTTFSCTKVDVTFKVSQLQIDLRAQLSCTVLNTFYCHTFLARSVQAFLASLAFVILSRLNSPSLVVLYSITEPRLFCSDLSCCDKISQCPACVVLHVTSSPPTGCKWCQNCCMEVYIPHWNETYFLQPSNGHWSWVTPSTGKSDCQTFFEGWFSSIKSAWSHWLSIDIMRLLLN